MTAGKASIKIDYLFEMKAIFRGWVTIDVWLLRYFVREIHMLSKLTYVHNLDFVSNQFYTLICGFRDLLNISVKKVCFCNL